MRNPWKRPVCSRGLAGVVGIIGRRPWLVLALVAVSCAACGIYTCRHLTCLTHRDDLISSNKDYLQRWQQYVDEFGDDDDMVVVVRGDDRPRMEKVLDELAAEIGKRPDSFERLFYKIDLTSLHQRALLFLPTDQIRQVHGHIQGMSLLLEPPVLNTLDPLFGWKSLSVQQLLREAERKLEVWKPGQPNPKAEDFFRQLDSICNGACDYLEDREQIPQSLAERDSAADRPEHGRPSRQAAIFLLRRRQAGDPHRQPGQGQPTRRISPSPRKASTPCVL